MAAVQTQVPDTAAEAKTKAAATKAAAQVANSVPVLRGVVAEQAEQIDDLVDAVHRLEQIVARLGGRRR